MRSLYCLGVIFSFSNFYGKVVGQISWLLITVENMNCDFLDSFHLGM